MLIFLDSDPAVPNAALGILVVNNDWLVSFNLTEGLPPFVINIANNNLSKNFPPHRLAIPATQSHNRFMLLVLYTMKANLFYS